MMRSGSWRWMLLATALYVVVCGMLVTIRWLHWRAGWDAGVFSQIVLSLFSGFHSAAEGPPSHFAVHFSPILALLYPVAALTHSALALQYTQIVLIAAVAPVLFALTRPYVGDALALRIGVLAILYPPLATGGLTDIHEVGFWPLLAVSLIWAADRRRWVAFAVLAALAMCVREDVLVQLVLIGAAGALLAWRSSAGDGLLVDRSQDPRRLARACAVVALVAVGIVYVYFAKIQQAFGAWTPGTYYQYSFASGPVAVAASIFTHPLQFAAEMFTWVRFTYVLEALVPLALLPLRTWWGLIALPGLAGVLLASDHKVWTMGTHYELLWAPWMLVAAAVALVHVQRQNGEVVARRWAIAALTACTIFLVFANPAHLRFYLDHQYHDLADSKRAMACVPAGASVSTHEDWFAQIGAHNPRAVAQQTQGVDYLVYADDYDDPTFTNSIRPALQAAVARDEYRVLCSFGRVHAYKKVQ